MIDPAAYRYHLPPELVAQEPTASRDASRLLVVDRGAGVRGLHVFGHLPDILRAGDLLVVNDSRVLPARLWTRRDDTGGRVELLLLAPETTVEPATATAPAALGRRPPPTDAPPWRALARPARRLRSGHELVVGTAATATPGGPRLRILATHPGGEVSVALAGTDPAAVAAAAAAAAGGGDGAVGPGDLAAVAEMWGDVPLPPYIRRDGEHPDPAARRAQDRQRYQTVYARGDVAAGASVAAPTAGLHFTPEVFARLAERGVETARVTLHVGPGTFRPPSAEQIAAGRLHAERFVLPAATARAADACRRAGGRVIAVGTTSLRVLETVARLHLPAAAPPGTVVEQTAAGQQPPPVFTGIARREAEGWAVAGITRLFLRPPERIAAADGLLTNFHLPGSSLLMLVAALTGQTSWRAAYEEAVARRLRFFSYGDAMLILPPEEATP